MKKKIATGDPGPAVGEPSLRGRTQKIPNGQRKRAGHLASGARYYITKETVGDKKYTDSYVRGKQGGFSRKKATGKTKKEGFASFDPKSYKKK